MERTSKSIRWRKIGGGSFRTFNGKIVKPNEVFHAKKEDIPEAFQDVIVPVDEVPAPEPEPAKEDVEKHTYTKQLKGGGWYNVVDENGKQMNTQSLKSAEADALIKSLNNISVDE